ncbi:MAG: vWA domain-containing protein, partial [Planctomycetota bacterium]
NLVFLLDVSGSMSSADKLPLLKRAFALLVDQLGENDKISIVVYAGASGTVLPPTSGDDKQKILAALNKLNAGGSTNGAAGIQLAYQTARENFQVEAINRVILATDGDFNVGTSNQSELVQLIEKERESGVFLTVLGLGRGNLKDSTMEKLADHGNGNYAYLDSLAEARKVLVTEAGGTLVTIAKDVKLQLEFNPRLVKAYRLIGYENRILAAQDFADDKKDAGEIGAGHTVTALYEIVPVGAKTEIKADPELKYQTKTELTAAAGGDEMITVKLRYKAPQGSKSKLVSDVVKPGEAAIAPGDNFEFSAAVAMFGMLLRNSKHKGISSYALAREYAQGSLGADKHGYRAEFVKLVKQAESLGASTR